MRSVVLVSRVSILLEVRLSITNVQIPFLI